VSFITGGDKQGCKQQAKVDKKSRQKQKKVTGHPFPSACNFLLAVQIGHCELFVG
jgi:hypothetical protein